MSGALKLSCSSLIFVLSFRCRRMKSRAEPPIPGEGIPPSRWSTCHLSWPGMPIPAVCSLRCCRCPRHAKEQRRAGPRGYRFPQNLPTDVKERSQKMCGSTFFSVSR
ncbi:uncharacterized protein LOC143694282 isoform X2 [Agelaius phoeniceus]|uniref:uncharacterized protein LOC143694282 isoform X2 n=1 Tax=Agelaius phoeniceus TaxID=39638 RepID=UPI004054A3A4